jgi:dTDP-4-amino-4,6-dideoxygalactose transaminase
MTTQLELKIPFVDLNAQYLSIRDEIDSIMSRVVASGQFAGGPWVEDFEDEFSRSVEARYAIGVGSGTAALELALKAVEVGPGDEVIVPANSFFATAEAVSNVGARPVFADVDPVISHLDIDSVASLVSSKTRAVIPVHLYGRAMDLTELEQLAERHHLEVIEDAAQAHGTEINGKKVGGSGRLTCFSFYPGKNLGAYGEAGAITCSNPRHAERLRLLRNHGSPTKYMHSLVGTNSRLDSIQAAVLSVKLRHLSAWNASRVRHAKSYATALRGSAICPPPLSYDGAHNFHLFVVRTRKRDALKHFLKERGIDAGIHYPLPLHLTEAYQALGYPGKGSLPVAEKLADEILSLPMFPELTEEQIQRVCSCLADYCAAHANEE